LGQYFEIQTVGFGAADLAYRLSNHPTGTWSKQKRFYRPHEYNTKDIIIYAAKAHLHLTGADLILTYATNYFDFGKLVKDDKAYYSRFLKTRIEPLKILKKLAFNFYNNKIILDIFVKMRIN